MMAHAIREKIKALSNPVRASQCMKYFKNGPGQYGEGDIFAGLSNPQCRQIAKIYAEISLDEIQDLIQGQFHEQRFIALVLLNQKSKRKTTNRHQIFQLYVRQMKWVNNWDLVDISAPTIVGTYILQLEASKDQKERKIRQSLYEWAASPCLWFRRISIISTFALIRTNKFEDTLSIAEYLLDDKQDLIHKAVGWMLREVGSRDVKILEQFLGLHYKRIPRTALRYAIQKFQQKKRQSYLKGTFIKILP